MIAIAGMHRSGTSMACQLLERLGVDFGDPAALYDADQWNAEGYYEVSEFMDLNSVLLTGFPHNEGALRRFASKVVYMLGSSDRAIRRRFTRLGPQMRELAARYETCAVKDPRFCLTLGLWSEVTAIERCVICVRHPAEVARSLKRRERIPLSWGFRFWNRHIRGLLDHAPRERSIVLDFNALRSGGATGELEPVIRFLALDLSLDDARERCKDVLRDDLVHHVATSDEGLPPATRELWSKLRALADERRAEVLNS